MKKTNKTYHLQESAHYKLLASPGKIIKNHGKIPRQKSSQKHNASVTHSRKQDSQEPSKRYEQRPQKRPHTTKTQKSPQHNYQPQNNYQYRFIEEEQQSSGTRNNRILVQQSQPNPYQQIYKNDLKYYQEYLHSTAKYEFNGINLNWPYYFSKSNFQNS